MDTCLYLRKSRSDIEAEARGEGETLSKHKQMLMKFAKENKINIVAIKEEIASGESIIHRPEMLTLLKEIEEGKYKSVLVMDVDRLGRGNMQEQGLILETFKKAKVKIITPRKTYDLHDEFDEEYSEFEAFMARKELKLINRRLQRGRVKSVEDGNYVGTRPPYGYDIETKGKERYLIPHPEQSIVVKLIFDMYVNRSMGGQKIAHELNAMGYKSYTGIKWQGSSVINIIKNEVYIGKIQWKKKEYKPSADPNKKRETANNPKSEWINVDGKHEAIIEEETFQKAQEILQSKSHVPYMNGITNPLAGVIKCGVCGNSMVYRPYGNKKPHLICYTGCGNKSARFDYVEDRILEALKVILERYKLNNKPYKKETGTDLNNQVMANLTKELSESEKQVDKLHDFLERGIYDEDTYLNRSILLSERISNIKAAILKAKKEIDGSKPKKSTKDIIFTYENVLRKYKETTDAELQNRLIKSIIEHVEYKKEKNQKGDDFIITLQPKV